MDSGKHIIHRVVLEVDTRSAEKADRIRNDISGFLKKEVFPRLEELFDKYDDGGIKRYGTITMELAVNDWDNLNGIKPELLRKISKKLNAETPGYSPLEPEETPGSLPRYVDPQNNLEATFLYFLKNGSLPWYGKQEYIDEITQPDVWEKSMEKGSFVSALRTVLQESEWATGRFVLQCADSVVLSLVERTGTLMAAGREQTMEFLRGCAFDFKNRLLGFLVNVSVTTDRQHRIKGIEKLVDTVHQNERKKIKDRGIPAMPKLRIWVESVFSKELVQKYFDVKVEDYEIKNSVSKEDSEMGNREMEQEDSDEIILENNPTVISQELLHFAKEKEPPHSATGSGVATIVRNAGLVLFHPFLKGFFTNFDWLDGDGMIKPGFLFHAVQALHYLATGDDDFFEADLLLEKLMCGIPFEMPVPRQGLLSGEVTAEGLVLLVQVIKHWPALKNTSPEGLRQMFVQREGKLVQNENGYKLLIERKAQDVLLDKLQWPVSIVKLPWMDDLLFVEW